MCLSKISNCFIVILPMRIEITDVTKEEIHTHFTRAVELEKRALHLELRDADILNSRLTESDSREVELRRLRCNQEVLTLRAHSFEHIVEYTKLALQVDPSQENSEALLEKGYLMADLAVQKACHASRP